MSSMKTTVIAGSSTKKSDDKINETNVNTWIDTDFTSFILRVGPNYISNKQKASANRPIMRLAAVDYVSCSNRIDNIGSKVILPDEWTNINTHHSLIPPVFIVNLQVPSQFTTSLFTEINNGPGWSLVYYFVMTNETSDSLIDINSASPGIRLFANYCQSAPENSESKQWKGRLKTITRCDNINDFGLPSFITSYNSKPVLIRNTGNLIRGDNNKYIEMDINIHKFSTLPKKGLQMLISQFERMDITMGFCIESLSDDEMPETLIGCGTIRRPQFTIASDWSRLSNQLETK